MKIQAKLFSAAAVLALTFLPAASSAQNNKTVAANQTAATAEIAASDANAIAAEIGLLRKSLQSLNTRLREINDKLTAQPIDSKTKQSKILLGLDILTRAEQRAELMRRQLIELSEKENAIKTRLIQLEEQMRSDNIERATNLEGGSTRAPELRENRRKSLEAERTGLSNLLYQIETSRSRLEDDVRDADALVAKLRRQLIPAIEREITNFTN